MSQFSDAHRRIKLFLWFVFVGLLPGAAAGQGAKSLPDAVDELAQKLSVPFAEGSRTRVAVVPFRNLDGKETLLVNYLSEALSTQLLAIAGRRIELIERSRLESALKELKNSGSPFFDSAEVKRVGKLAQADALVTGVLTALPTFLEINTRMVEVETGKILAAGISRVVWDDNLRALQGGSQTVTAPQVGGPVVPSTSPSPQESTARITLDKWKFELLGCRVQGNALSCSLRVTNEAEDRALSMYTRYSRAYDDEGNETAGSVARLGDKGASGGGGLEKRMISGIPIPLEITFEGFRPASKLVSVLEIVVNSSTATFRVISLRQ